MAKSNKAAEAEAVKARVLVRAHIAGEWRSPNEVVTLTDAELQAHAGQVDPHPDAVAYAEALASKD